MREILYSVMMLAAVTFTACSNEEMGETETPKRGLTLHASMENLSTRASMTDESGTWKFAFENNDQVSVTNTKITDFYTFQNVGDQFTCANAEATTENADWYAYYPDNKVDLTNQTGLLKDVANKLAAVGQTAQATTGKDGLAITLHAQVAVLRIVEADKEGALDIQVKTAKDKWVTGLSAQKNQTTFNVVTSDTKTTLLSKENVKAGDFSYVVVPAGMTIKVYNGKDLISQTKEDGLAAGKYYTITSLPTQGQSYASINDKKELVDWVQLWPGGPRFATKNVAEPMTWTDAVKTGKDFAWGENWRTPNADEIMRDTLVNKEATFGGFCYNWHENTTAKGSPSIKIEQKDANNAKEDIVTFTGVYPGYTKTQLTLYNQIDKHGDSHFDFWTTSESNNYGGKFSIIAQGKTIGGYGMFYLDNKNTPLLVRPVLAK